MRWDRVRRKAYFADVKKTRGATAVTELIGEVNRQWCLTQETEKQASLL